MAKRRRPSTKVEPTEEDSEEELCEYERQRLAHIQRNVEYMRMMGLLEAKEALMEGVAAKQEAERTPPRARPEKVPVPPEQLRRSERLMGKTPQYTGENIEGPDRELEKKARPRKRNAEEMEAQRQEMVETSRRWLEDSRRSLAVLGVNGKLPEKAQEWHAEAVRRWGNGVDTSATEDWEAYVLSRLSRPPPPSPLDLLQEYYAHDTWQLLVACALMSRVSSWKVKNDCISAFFREFPTPTAAVQANHGVLQRILYPLGLFDNRLRTLLELSQKFLAMPIFALDLKADRIWGCGAFTVDSFRIFCRDEGGAMHPEDATLQSFVNWRRKELKSHPQAETGEATEGAKRRPQKNSDTTAM